MLTLKEFVEKTIKDVSEGAEDEQPVIEFALEIAEGREGVVVVSNATINYTLGKARFK